MIENRPYISLIMTAKNGMPYLQQALESAASQSFTDFELVIQDGQSTDGSLEVFRSFKEDPRLRDRLYLVSEKDKSLAEAKTKAFSRCRGEIIGSIDTDNLLEPDCLQFVADYFCSNPEVAVLYGSQYMIDTEGKRVSDFHPQGFNILDHLECRLIPPFGSAFFRAGLVGDGIHAAPDLLYCADYELWINLSHLKIACTDQFLCSTRISPSSITCRPESCAQMSKDKVTALHRFLDRYPQDHFTDALRRRAEAGIYIWIAEIVKYIFPNPAGSLQFAEYLKRAFELDPESPRLKQLMERAGMA